MDNYLHDMFIDEALPALKRHSGGGGTSNPGTIILVDTNGQECTAVLTEDRVDLTATVEDIRDGETAITEFGIQTGVAFIPKEQTKGVSVTKNGVLEIVPDKGCALTKVVVDAQIFDGTDKDPRVNALISGKIVEFSDDEIAEIGPYAFYNKELFVNINTPEVTTIGEYAFAENSSLTSISFPKVTTIGERAFENCRSLTDVSLPLIEELNGYIFYNAPLSGTVYMPNVKTIGSGAFSYALIEDINFPNVTTIGFDAFSWCSKAESANLPLVTSLGSSVFTGCTSLKTVSIPEVTAINVGTFSGCSSLTSIEAPKVTSLNYQPFDGCESLTEIAFPNVTNIDGPLVGWSKNNSITTAIFPSLVNMAYDCFRNMAALRTIDLSKSVAFGSECFSGCVSLDTLILRNSDIITTLSGGSYSMITTPFYGQTPGSRGIVLTPRSMIDLYQNDMGWMDICNVGSCEFLELEDYTVDGTITGQVDFEKLETYRGGGVV